MHEGNNGFSYRVTTLGCRVNRADSLAIERRLAGAGGRRAVELQRPVLWVVNTCAVTAEAMRKSRKAVRRCVESGARVIVTGCASEMEPGAFELIAGAGSIVPNSEKDGIAALVSGGPPGDTQRFPYPPAEVVRVPLKAQDGCSRFCTYCIVPYLRGDERSRRVESIAAELRELRDAGAGEVVLCGIDLGSYRDPTNGAGLVELVERLLEERGRMWLRLSSLELSDVSDDLLALMVKNEGMCRHLHLPLQSGDRGVLADMGRSYDPADFARRVTEIRDEVPGIATTTDVMVGFPTETEEAFEKTRTLLQTVGFSRVHVFKYSPRPGTAAYGMGDPVEAGTKERRAACLRAVAGEMAGRFYKDFNGRIMPVLVEATMKSERGRVFGRAQNFAGVVMDGGRGLVGEFASVRVNGSSADGLTGEVISVLRSDREGEGY